MGFFFLVCSLPNQKKEGLERSDEDDGLVFVFFVLCVLFLFWAGGY